MSDRLRTARLVGVGLLALVLFNFPLLGVFDTDTLVAGSRWCGRTCSSRGPS